MPNFGVATVVSLRIDPVDEMHQCRQIRLARMQHQMIVIAHQAKSQCAGIKTHECQSDHIDKRLTVDIIIKNGFAPVTTRGDVIHRAGKLNP